VSEPLGRLSQLSCWSVSLTSTSDMRASLSGKDVPEDIKARLLALHEDNVVVREALKTAQDKLAKARQVCGVAKDEFCSLSLAFVQLSLSSLRTNFSRRSRPNSQAVRQ
jgi:hypothetical protein